MPNETLTTSAIGWFGKLPATGDFIGRKIPPGFISEWDNWLCTGMVEAQKEFGEHWNDFFLTFPVWCFLRCHSVPIRRNIHEQILWAGVLSPSADSVGRLFPITVWFEVPVPLFLAVDVAVIEARLTEIANFVLKVLKDDDLGAFEQSLEQLPPLQLPFTKCLPATAPCSRSVLKESFPSLSAWSDDLGKHALLNYLEKHAAFWNQDETSNIPMLLLPEPLDPGTFLSLVDPEQQIME